MATTICSYDHNLIFTGGVATIPDRDPIPRGWVATEKPQGEAKYWQWQSTKWAGLDKYPKPLVPVPTVPEYDKVKIVEAMIAMGQQELLAKKIAESDTAIQLRFSAYPTLKGDDKDFLKMMKEFQKALGMTDEQRDKFLADCKI